MRAQPTPWRLPVIVAGLLVASVVITLWLYAAALPREPSLTVPAAPSNPATALRSIYYERFEAAEVRELQRERSEHAALAAEAIVIVIAAAVASFPYFIESMHRE